MRWIKSRRLGKFFIGVEAINDCPEAIMKLMSAVIVLDADTDIFKQGIEYTAISEHFEELEEGEKLPFYGLRFTERKDSVAEIEFRRAGEADILVIENRWKASQDEVRANSNCTTKAVQSNAARRKERG